jgi:hypothetical protein
MTTKITKTIVLNPGDTFVLPAGAVITDLITSGTISLSSTCGALPAQTPQQCYNLAWSSSTNSSPDSLLEHNLSKVDSIKIGGISYTVNIDPSDGTALTTAFQSIAAALPGIFDFVSFTIDSFSNFYNGILVFRSIPSIAEAIEVTLSGNAYPNKLYVRPAEQTCP